MIGYYSKEGGQIGRCWSGTHIIHENPICGYKPAKDMKLQFCSYNDNAYKVECKKCQKLLKEQLNKNGGLK